MKKKSEAGGQKPEIPEEQKAKSVKPKAVLNAEDSTTIDPPTGGSSEIKEPLTSHNSPLTTMEVHHHPQLEHKPKPWKEYVLEGLMIFLAVTMGFFAESLREHLADKNKERKIIASLAKDIKKDTASLDNNINVYLPTHNRWLDSAENEINSLPLKGNDRKITRAIINATNWQVYTPPEVALDILKHSGTFNLIENEKVKTVILTFNADINEYIKYSE